MPSVLDGRRILQLREPLPDQHIHNTMPPFDTHPNLKRLCRNEQLRKFI